MMERERQGGTAALTALVSCPLEGAIGADGLAQSGSNGNGSSDGSSGLPELSPDAYVWVQTPAV